MLDAVHGAVHRGMARSGGTDTQWCSEPPFRSGANQMASGAGPQWCLPFTPLYNADMHGSVCVWESLFGELLQLACALSAGGYVSLCVLCHRHSCHACVDAGGLLVGPANRTLPSA